MAQQIGALLKQKSSPSKSQTQNEIALKKQELAVFEYDEKDKKQITSALGACLVVQKAYGKQASDLVTMTNIFVKVLNKYSPEQVIGAVKGWILQSDEFPTPSDIEKILNPQPQFCKEVYIGIDERRRRGEFISDAEAKYQRLYRNNMMKGL